MRFLVNSGAILGISVLASSLLTFGVIRAAPSFRFVSKQELSKTLKFYRDIQVLTVDFKMAKRMKGIPTILRSEGQLRVIRPNILIWKIAKPAPLTVDIGKDEVKITSGTGEELMTQTFRIDQIAESADATRFQSMNAWLKMDAEKLSQDYEIEKAPNGTFIFTPKIPTKVPFSKLTMSLNLRGDLQKLLMEERSGDSTEFVFGPARVKSK